MTDKNDENGSVRKLIAQNLQIIQKYRLFPDAANESLNIDVKSFVPSDKVMDLVAVDGSYSFILNLSSMWLAVIRVGALHYRFSEDKGYELIDSRVKEKPVLVSTKKDIMEKMGEMHGKLYEATRYASEQHREMVNQLRRLMEEEMASELAKSKSNVIIAMDGTLTPLKSTNILERAVQSCTDNNNILLGVSKDSYTHAFKSYRTDEEVLSNLEYGGIGYVPAPLARRANKDSLLYDKMLGDVYFAKLHPDASKWFRIDIGTFKRKPDMVFSQLAHYSKSRLCLGYIYPLLEAHRYVVTVRYFHTLYEDMILNMASDYDISIAEAINALTHLEGNRKGAFHEYLDQVSREI
ncbi:MAG: DNA double-strand break repair nuclease NurA [Methanomassiliicoccales archaeon]|nr:MAG: DNA double-strand break repair nuclease NurA [Methanomassiliicoccales archaeon]